MREDPPSAQKTEGSDRSYHIPGGLSLHSTLKMFITGGERRAERTWRQSDQPEDSTQQFACHQILSWVEIKKKQKTKQKQKQKTTLVSNFKKKIYLV